MSGTGGSASFLSPPAATEKEKMNDHSSFVFPSPKAASQPPALLCQAKDSQEVGFTAEPVKEITRCSPHDHRAQLGATVREEDS